MNASTRTARRILKARRDAGTRREAGTRRTLATYVSRIDGATRATVKAVAAALRDKARVLRQSGALGAVKTRIEHVSADRLGPVYRYTKAQLAKVLAAYKPRKAEYVAAKIALLANV